MKFSFANSYKFATPGSYAASAVSEVLTNYTKSISNDDSGYIFDKIFTPVSVKKESGEVYNHGKQSMRVVETRLSRKGNVNQIDFDVQKDAEWKLKMHGLMADVKIDEVENADAPLDAQMDNAALLGSLMKTRKEATALSVFNPTTLASIATQVTGTDVFTDTANSDPFVTIQALLNKVRTQCGRYPNNIAFASDVVDALTIHPKVIARFPGAAIVGVDIIEKQLGSLFKVPNVHIARAMEWGGNGGAIDGGDLTELLAGKIVAWYDDG